MIHPYLRRQVRRQRPLFLLAARGTIAALAGFAVAVHLRHDMQEVLSAVFAGRGKGDGHA